MVRQGRRAILWCAGRQHHLDHPGDGPVRRERGFSMVELLLTGGVVSVFVGSRTAYQATAGVGDMSDSGRFALNLIGESVRGAGNLACNSAMSATNQPFPGATFINNYGQGIEGFEAAS